MSELTGRAKNRANAAQASPGPVPKAAPEPADDARLAGLTGTDVSSDDAVVRRTKDGWRVGDADLPDLTSAMVLADLISAELARPENLADEPAAGMTEATAASAATAGATAASTAAGNAAVPAEPEDTAGKATATDQAAATAQAAARGGSTGRAGKAKVKGRAKDPASVETSKLRTTIGQLEHALTARIRVEQAIGVLAERHRIQPRQAFEQLRTAARNRGRRVIDIASDVDASATNPLLQLPDELSRPRATGRQGRRNRQTPGVLSSE
jgi:hypothetical protein